MELTINLKPLLHIIDNILNDFFQRYSWGYSLPNYLSAMHNAHPNYATYLDDKKTLTIKEMNDIFDMMSDDCKVCYNKNYIEDLYIRYMTAGKVQNEHQTEIRERLAGKKLLLIAPGKSSFDKKEKIKKFSDFEDVISVSVNFSYPYKVMDYIFLSNIRRFKELDDGVLGKCIVTSNISSDKVYLQTKYYDLLATEESVKDNAGLMAVKFFINQDIEEIYLAGFDGYSHDVSENYGDSHMEIITRNAVLDAINKGMGKILKEYSHLVRLNFLTEPKYVALP